MDPYIHIDSESSHKYMATALHFSFTLWLCAAGCKQMLKQDSLSFYVYVFIAELFRAKYKFHWSFYNFTVTTIRARSRSICVYVFVSAHLSCLTNSTFNWEIYIIPEHPSAPPSFDRKLIAMGQRKWLKMKIYSWAREKKSRYFSVLFSLNLLYLGVRHSVKLKTTHINCIPPLFLQTNCAFFLCASLSAANK